MCLKNKQENKYMDVIPYVHVVGSLMHAMASIRLELRVLKINKKEGYGRNSICACSRQLNACNGIN